MKAPWSKYLFAIILPLALFGCSTSFKYRVNQSQSVASFYQNGYNIGGTGIDGVNYYITAEKQQNGYIRLWVNVENKSNQNVNVIPEDFSVIGSSSYGSQRLYVFPPDQYLAKLRSDQNWAMAAQAFSAGMSAHNAGKKKSTTNSYTNASAYDSYGNYAYGNASTTSTTNTYDYAAAENARLQNQATLNQQAAYYNNVYNAVENGILKSVTLFPGQSVAGNVMIKHKSSYDDRLKIVVPVYQGKSIEISFMKIRR
jgi:hypothetical protein